MNLRFIFGAIKPFLGVLDLKVDRTRQIITFKRNGQAETMTVDQLFDEIEGIFSEARRREPASQVTLDPFGGGTIDRKEAPWLSDYSKPAMNPLSQAV